MITTDDRITDYVQGVVAKVGNKGFRLGKDGDWLTVSQHARPMPKLPEENQIVRVGIDDRRFVYKIDIVGGQTSHQASHDSQEASQELDPGAKLLVDVRMAAMQIASAHSPKTAKPEDLIKFALQIEDYYLR